MGERMDKMTGWLRRRSKPEDRRSELVLDYVRRGLPVCPAVHPAVVGCSCDRVGCPAPGMHPISLAWQSQATTDPERVAELLYTMPMANFVTPTGRTHDVLDVPSAVGKLALMLMDEEGIVVGPVASCGPDRHLFFTATRGIPEDEDEWWPCELDCHPESVDDHPGLRWHCRGSYVLIPPSVHPSGQAVRWLRGPERPLPDPVRILSVLTDVYDSIEGQTAYDSATNWVIGI
jgi:Bifunctional DNA primase/polymerase, N-terminal